MTIEERHEQIRARLIRRGIAPVEFQSNAASDIAWLLGRLAVAVPVPTTTLGYDEDLLPR